VADERGSSVYAAYIKDQLADQDARKSSIEQRGITVITTSGTLVSLLFGLAAILTGVQDYDLPDGARCWLYAAMVAFVIASLEGIATNLPLFYIGVSARALRQGIRHKWDDEPAEAERQVAFTQVNVLERAQQLNTYKGFILLGAIVAEVIAVVFLALAIRIILTHG
jgi:hypothetical protein